MPGTGLGLGGVAVRTAHVELTFRVRWGKKRQIKHMDDVMNGKCYGKKSKGDKEGWVG